MYTVTVAPTTIEVQQSSALSVQTVLTPEILARQQALLERQGNLIKELATFENQAKVDEKAVIRKSEMKEYLSRQAQSKDAIAQIRAMMADTRSQLLAIEAQTTGPTFISTNPPPELIFGRTESEIVIAGGFLLLFPLIVAFAIRIMKRSSSTAQAPIPADRFTRLENAMETIAVEVERLGESQRFTSKLLNEAQPKQPAVTVKPSYDRLMRTPV